VRPQIAVAILVAIAFVLSMISTAEAGRRSKKGRKARAQERAEKKARRQKSRAPKPAPDAATADGAPDAAADAPIPPAGGKPAGGGKAPRGEKVFDFSGLELAGSVRMPQLLYFLDRAEEELERASLERRSFVPAMMRSLDEESL
jgi:hypothetical protein